MALQTGVAASKILILVGAGVTGSVVLRSGHLSELISNLQELIKKVDEAETSPGNYDAAILVAQVRQLAKEIKELSLSNPVTIFNGNSSSSGSYASYILPTAAIGAMGYCYMRWKGWSFSDIMYVTKNNMANAVETVSKQLDNVSEALTSTKRHLTKRLENLDWKMDEQREISKLVANDVTEVRSNLNQIGLDIGLIHEMVSGLEGKIELLESKQDMTNSGLWYLCQVAGHIKDDQSSKIIQDVGAKLIDNSTVVPEGERVKGLQFIVGNDESSMIQKTTSNMDGKGFADISSGKVSATKMRIHRSYPVGLSFAQNIMG
ncbi:phd finger protein male sterility 1 [Phtheirospermum japonicum]|uniref:Phd finger protein male sterility 1 n=1 Tax=Phtheirospermum japonicum TaxID=374723 RepID=A0A830BNL6_9LAMI|nr:phd finger protein male sterility 1 [Phtheirospermum japonicum]